MYNLLGIAFRSGQQSAETCRYSLHKPEDGTKGWEVRLRFQEAEGIESVFCFVMKRSGVGAPEELHERKNRCIEKLIKLHEESSRDSKEMVERNALLQEESRKLQELIKASVRHKNQEEQQLYEAFRRGLTSQKDKYAQLLAETQQLRGELVALRKMLASGGPQPVKRKTRAMLVLGDDGGAKKEREEEHDEDEEEEGDTPRKKRRFTDNAAQREARRRRIEAIEAARKGKEEEEEEDDEDLVQATQHDAQGAEGSEEGMNFGSDSAASFGNIE
eukprot:TRINITY_DN17117_c0_g1_i1.p1 TRINITY_DN17117_c0_g1~~TRINITY_DN17117_c0_g1_i1.p1  ORF type:complete len:297 (-),score=-7.56 TRINITY_DN17117_c0_g1_i1:33-854(-)